MSFTSPTAGPPSLQHSIQGPEGLPGLATSLLWVVPGGAPSLMARAASSDSSQLSNDAATRTRP